MSSKRKAPQAKARTVPSVLGWRFAFVLLSLAAVFSALVARAAWLQVVEPDMLVSQGDMRSLRVEADTVLRGFETRDLVGLAMQPASLVTVAFQIALPSGVGCTMP